MPSNNNLADEASIDKVSLKAHLAKAFSEASS